jgi:alpha-beta hydrolase superfamily lysophospholipase
MLRVLKKRSDKLFWNLGCLFTAVIVASCSASASIQREDNSTLSNLTGVPLYVWYDDAATGAQDICIAVHGSAQQGGVMNTLADNLVRLGFVVIAPDIRGNGRWQFSGKSQASMYEDLFQSIGDLQNILAAVRKTYPKSRIFLIGESIGVGIILKAVSNSPRQVKGVILCSAGVQPHLHNPLNMGPDFLIGMAHLVRPVDLGNYLTRYSSDDARVSQEMVQDPLARKNQTGLDLLGTFNFLNQEPEFARKLPSHIPVLMLDGKEDQIVEPASADKIFAELKTKKKESVMIPGAGHVLIGTSFIKPEVLSCLQNWMLQVRGGNKIKKTGYQ